MWWEALIVGASVLLSGAWLVRSLTRPATGCAGCAGKCPAATLPPLAGNPKR